MIEIAKKFVEKAGTILIIELTVVLILVLAGIIFKAEKDTDVIIKNAKLDIDDKIKANDSIKLEIENINKIKDAEVIEISSLDNDSTVKLFYKLVKE